MSKLCESRREEAVGGRTGRRQAGVQNQNQEPHTKMWGMTVETVQKLNLGSVRC